MTTEQRFQRVERELDEVRRLLTSAATHAESANRNYNQLSLKVDEFIFQAQRLFTQQAQILERVDGRTESLQAVIEMLSRGQEAQRYQFGEFQAQMLSTSQRIERNQQSIERILQYLENRNGGSPPP